jgi:glycosyltransferase involved in cell wall biosynthesis
VFVSTLPLPSSEGVIGAAHVPLPFSVVVPVHNEAPIVDAAVRRMVRGLEALCVDFEMIVCENGSTDATAALVERIKQEEARVRLERLVDADYGGALRHGIRPCRHDRVVIFNIDFWSVDFTREALKRLDTCDLVVGSKVMSGAGDHRPAFRRFITRAFNDMLRVCFGFSGTDTHGIKAFRRDALAQVLARCVTSQSIFDTELVLHAERSGLRIVEVPVEVCEIRQPSYWAVIRRLPEVTWNLLKLAVSIRRS